MKRYIVSGILSLLMFSCSQEDVLSPYNPENFYEAEGKLKKLHNLTDDILIEHFYDEKGNLLKKNKYSKGQLTHYWIYTYNQQNDLIKETQYYSPNHSDQFTVSTITDYEYQGQLLLKEIITYPENGEIQHIDYEYDHRNNLIKQIRRKGDEEPLSTYIFTYNDQNQLIEKIEGDHLNTSRNIYQYEGNLLKRMDWRNEEDQLVLAYEYFYNQQDSLSHINFINGFFYIDEIKEGPWKRFTYDDEGKLIKEEEWYPNWPASPPKETIYEYY